MRKKYLLRLGKRNPLSKVRVHRLCLEIKQGSIGVLENWSIGLRLVEASLCLGENKNRRL